MRTSPARPKVITLAPVCAAIATTRSSSALSTAVRRRGQRLDELALGDAPPRRSHRPVRCGNGRPSVTTPMSGRATSHSRAISPNPRIPISSTSTSVSSGAFRIVTGRPCSLLKLRTLAVVRASRPRRGDRSFVDVLPTLPVTPTTRAGRSATRPQRPSVISAADVSATSIAVPPSPESTGRLVR